MITNTTMKNLSVNASHQYWQHLGYIGGRSNLEWIVRVSGSVPGEILIYLDLFLFFFFLLAVDAPSVRTSIFSRSRLFSFFRYANARARSHTSRHGMMKTSECEHLFHFIRKRERRWIKDRFIFFFSSFSLQTLSKRSDNNNKKKKNNRINPTETFFFHRTAKKGKEKYQNCRVLSSSFFLSHRLYFHGFIVSRLSNSNEIESSIDHESGGMNSIGTKSMRINQNIPIFFSIISSSFWPFTYFISFGTSWSVRFLSVCIYRYIQDIDYSRASEDIRTYMYIFRRRGEEEQREDKFRFE